MFNLRRNRSASSRARSGHRAALVRFVPRMDRLEGRALLTTVTNLADSGGGSLRAAIAAGGTVTFDPGLKGTITLLSELVIAKPVTITYAGPGLTLAAKNPPAGAPVLPGVAANRVFDITTSGKVTITGFLTIAHGLAAHGGGIENAGGATLTIEHCTFTGNQAFAVAGEAPTDLNGRGGAIDNLGGKVTLGDCTFTDNVADGNAFVIPGGNGLGGAIANLGGTVMFDGDCTFTGNFAQGGMAFSPMGSGGIGAGGAIYNAKSAGGFPGTLTNVGPGTATPPAVLKFSANKALGGPAAVVPGFTTLDGKGEGGAIANGIGSAVTLTGGTFATNTAICGLGQDGFGGGLYNDHGKLTLERDTFTENSALGAPGYDGHGGGIDNEGGTVTINGCSLMRNLAHGGEGVLGASTDPNPTTGGPGGPGSAGGDAGNGLGGGVYSVGGTLSVGHATSPSPDGTIPHTVFSWNKALGGDGGDGGTGGKGGPGDATHAGGPGGDGGSAGKGGSGEGGGIYALGGVVTVDSTDFQDNMAEAGKGGDGGVGGSGGDFVDLGGGTISTPGWAGSGHTGGPGGLGEGGGLYYKAVTASDVAVKVTSSMFVFNYGIGGYGGDGGDGGAGGNHNDLHGHAGSGGTGGDGMGGGIAHEGSAPLLITSDTFTSNQAWGGGGGSAALDSTASNGAGGGSGGKGQGGGIANSGGTTLTVTLSTFGTNKAWGGDGAPGGRGNIITDLPSYDKVVGNGGNAGQGGDAQGAGIFNKGATDKFTLATCHFTYNVALGGSGGDGGAGGHLGGFPTSGKGGDGGLGGNAWGGGIDIEGIGDPVLAISKTEFAANLAIGGDGGDGNPTDGGAGKKGGDAVGAGLWIKSAKVTITKTTISGNKALGGTGGTGSAGGASGPGGTGQGGGIFTSFAYGTVKGSSITKNEALAGAGTPGALGQGGGYYYVIGGKAGVPSLTFDPASTPTGNTATDPKYNDVGP